MLINVRSNVCGVVGTGNRDNNLSRMPSPGFFTALYYYGTIYIVLYAL
jgi:hypothetical protein